MPEGVRPLMMLSLLSTVIVLSLGALMFAEPVDIWVIIGGALILAAVATFMPPGLPRGKKGTKFSAVFPKTPEIRALSLARMFLFATRDTWFVVAVPVFFYEVITQSAPERASSAFFLIGAFMAAWVICYGAVQASAATEQMGLPSFVLSGR